MIHIIYHLLRLSSLSYHRMSMFITAGLIGFRIDTTTRMLPTFIPDVQSILFIHCIRTSYHPSVCPSYGRAARAHARAHAQARTRAQWVGGGQISNPIPLYTELSQNLGKFSKREHKIQTIGEQHYTSIFLRKVMVLSPVYHHR